MTDLFLPGLGPLAWIDVVLLGWFVLTALSVAYVAWAAWRNPEPNVMRWGWVLVTLYMGPIAAGLVHKVAPRLLGATVGGFIILTNVRTLLNQFEVVGAGRTLTYLVLCALWGAAVAWAVRQHRLARTRAATMAAGAPDEPVPTPVG